MKQGVISLIPKPDKDLLVIDNWRPISLLTLDYKILASVYAKRLSYGLGNIIFRISIWFHERPSHF